MAIPAVAAVNYSEEGLDTTTHDVLLPAGIASGDRLILFAVLDGITTISGMPAGWTSVASNNMSGGGGLSFAIWEKIGATGSETAFTYTSSASENSTNRTWRVTGTHASSASEIAEVTSAGGSPTVGFQPLTPSWGADDTLWVAFTAMDGTRTVTVWPTSYIDNQFTDNTGGGIAGAGIALSSRGLNAAMEQPTAMTLNTNANKLGIVLGIRPTGAVGAEALVDPMGMSGFFGG